MTNTKFPIIADDEIMLTEMPHMNLYDELDLISNIKGDYHDRNYLEWMPIAKPESPAHAAPSQTVSKARKKQAPVTDFKKPIDKKDPAIRYAEQAREEARADLRKKRSAAYLTSKLPNKVRSRKVAPSFEGNPVKPTAPFQKENSGELTKFSNKLKQDSYILADIQPQAIVEAPANQEKKKKNNYDFLKTSQVYNKGNKREKHNKHKKAQELDITKLSSDAQGK